MRVIKTAAIAYTVISGGVIAFQIELAAGKPRGQYAMGAAYPGVFPVQMRVAAAVQAVLLAVLALVVASRAGVGYPAWVGMSRWAIWIAVAFAVMAAVLNIITPSASERMIWAPIAILMLASVLTVAVGTRRADRIASAPTKGTD